jgi:hypothetical protein
VGACFLQTSISIYWCFKLLKVKISLRDNQRESVLDCILYIISLFKEPLLSAFILLSSMFRDIWA